MEPNVVEALKAKVYAEKHFAEGDFTGAINYALKAQMIFPQLEGISQMIATFGVYTASEVRINGEVDLYGILGVEPSADKSRIKKQYKKMAVLLHPDKNKSTGADGAFKYISDAWTVLSDHAKRSMYDHRRNISSLHAPGNGSYINYSKPQAASHHRLDTFWTVCTSCHVQYEYLRKYVNKRLSCKNCRGVFIAVETGTAPASGSYQYSPWSYAQDKGYGGHGCGAAYMPNNTTVYRATNDVSGYHPGHGSEYPSNVTIQFNSIPGTPASGTDPNGFSTSTYVNHQPNGKGNRAKANVKDSMKKIPVNVVSNGHDGTSDNLVSKPGWSAKKRKVEAGSGSEEPTRNNTETRAANANGNLKMNSKLNPSTETSVRRHATAPAFDVRQLLIDKARSDIRKKVEEMRLASEAEKKRKALAEAVMSGEAVKTSESNSTTQQSELKRTVSMSITVPDSDFHDFDKDRSEECFKPKQIWALYDEEDGMPRLYCLIRQVISVKPFKIFISYLSSKTDSEFGSVNWLGSGFTKSCGSFRVFNSETIEQVNIFSHLLSKEKAGRGGCVRIYPRSGDIWAVYRNWSPDWNRQTPEAIRHQYEMVEVLDNYSEDLGVCATPLVKVDGYKTVYHRNNTDPIKWIPKREMLRFSHQVPACLLKGEAFNLPDDCWDLDPAAIPDGLLQKENELLNHSIPNEADERLVTQSDQYPPVPSLTSRPEDAHTNDQKHAPAATEVQVLDRCQSENRTISQFELTLAGANVPA